MLRHRARIAEHSARVEAELASRVKSEFIATMSHELRTPLNTIIGFSKLLGESDRRRFEQKEVKEFADLINDAAGHLLSIINDILDISKIQSGRFTLDERDVDLDEILRTVVGSFRLTAQQAGVTLTYDIDAELPAARGDAVKLRQVMTNLVSNAIKFTPAGGTVAVEARPISAGAVEVSVSDSGVGMSDDEIKIALTPFGQVDGSLARWRDGTGLGLPIAESLVRLHGGRLEVSSRKGAGTRVTVTLPKELRKSNDLGRAARHSNGPAQ